ncbi:MmyB family transcriptional regulator [Streptomyces sp. RPT161]|uniref:MmyB family transcriptional regulator n=1 Tax=Streptomyces sp. RPT161 TaxID=3015993 RepID=UPI0022B8A7B1|nr:hypothetical protein [Streptomyces sp. RPT161]
MAVFNGDTGRVRHPLPEDCKKSLVADPRDMAARYPADSGLVGVISALRQSGPDLARPWEHATVAHHGNERKTIDHPEVGELELDCDVLSMHGADPRIIVFTAAPRGEAADKLRLLTVLAPEDTAAPQLPQTSRMGIQKVSVR